MFGMSGGLKPWMSAAEKARWFAVREAVAKGRQVSAIIELEDKLFECEAEKQTLADQRDAACAAVAAIIDVEDKLLECQAEKQALAEERDAARAAVAALQAEVRQLERDKRTLTVQAWETKHIYR